MAKVRTLHHDAIPPLGASDGRNVETPLANRQKTLSLVSNLPFRVLFAILWEHEVIDDTFPRETRDGEPTGRT